MFVLNLLLAILWTLLTGEIRPASFLTGFVLGFAALWLVLRGPETPGYFRRVPLLLRFAGFFLWTLIQSSLRVAREVLTPRLRMRPGVVAVPLDVTQDAAITLLANLITLTPGALALDLSEDRRTLFVHEMYASDPDAVRRAIKDGFERRVLELVR